MQLTEDSHDGRYHLSQFDENGFTINKTHYDKSLVLGRDILIDTLLPSTPGELSQSHTHAILEHQPQIVIIGTGSEAVRLSPDILMPLYQHHIGVEVMTTPAACRTMSVLLAENRDVIALLFR